jgi:hypothetical protein
MMVSPHSITANAPGLHRISKNSSMMIGEHAAHAAKFHARPGMDRVTSPS